MRLYINIRTLQNQLYVCYVKILDRYLEFFPPEAVDKEVLYLIPLPKVSADPIKPWFKTVPDGKID